MWLINYATKEKHFYKQFDSLEKHTQGNLNIYPFTTPSNQQLPSLTKRNKYNKCKIIL